MLEKIKVERLDVVVATRNAEGGSMGEFSRSGLASTSWPFPELHGFKLPVTGPHERILHGPQ